jgi:hypothetical protein
VPEQVSERLRELASVFGGDKPLTRVKKNTKLQSWFEMLAAQIDEMHFESTADDSIKDNNGKKLMQMCQRLTEVGRRALIHTHSVDAGARSALTGRTRKCVSVHGRH